jgi:hypothetical protein
LVNIETAQKTISKRDSFIQHQERQQGVAARTQAYEKENEMGANKQREEHPDRKILPISDSSDVGVRSSFKLPISTSSSKIEAIETTPELLISSHKRLKYMKAASQKVTLQRLQEVWDSNVDDIFKEVEAEKQWWLHMAYEKLRRNAWQISSSPEEREISSKLGTDGNNALLLYHNQGKSSLF